LLTVSVAAQLGTSPISIYYFTQFPNYFMLSNLSVIALSFVVIITGVVLLPISLIPVIPKYLSWLLTMEIRVMNRIIVFIEQLPHSVTENIDYHFLQVLLLYGVIGCFCSLLYHKNRKVFWTACVLGVLFCGSFPIKKLALTKETEFLAYHLRKSSALGFCYHGQLILFSDSIRTGKDKLYQYNIRNHVRKRCQNATIVPIDTGEYDTPFLCKRGNFIRFGDKTYYLLNRSERVLSPPKGMTLHADCLIIRQNPRQPPDEVMVVLPFYEVVADATNTPFYVERWRAFCVENGIPFMFTGNRNLESGT
jgi:competence protein ComEC